MLWHKTSCVTWECNLGILTIGIIEYNRKSYSGLFEALPNSVKYKDRTYFMHMKLDSTLNPTSGIRSDYFKSLDAAKTSSEKWVLHFYNKFRKFFEIAKVIDESNKEVGIGDVTL